MQRITLEVCVDDVAGLCAAAEGGADRIELCAGLEVGGLTPSRGLMARAAALGIPVLAMIRPRAGDFVYDAATLDVMRADIDTARQAGLAGVVLGASRPDGRLDEGALAALTAHAAGLEVALHRAFDLVPDPLEALETAVSLGFVRILTSGGCATALAGAETIAAVTRASRGRIVIMPGSGVRLDTVSELLAKTGAREVHASCSVSHESADPRVAALGWGSPLARRTDRATVEALRHRLNGLSAL
ncbi:copper homeostasis protein CutC [Vitiosangium sp. GDMCC 1.1324]|uniref:copper homeostasis protein CutC n=1 Tax=Vitiosangium sp. (strain GDMCC 1.1324) TaxID=2138576 RepID=UPI000D3B9EB8|nr:copper homeostasis protein CutC [Vitiosangium sp. GDMCC 1.1324]PTL85913.1 copper homeostasis protein CutC [Vitiosangium sp. GDMCC 1.1324]